MEKKLAVNVFLENFEEFIEGEIMFRPGNFTKFSV
jgi:hypothetical protein